MNLNSQDDKFNFRDRSEKGFIKRVLSSPKFFTFIAASLAIILFIPAFNNFQKRREINKEIVNLKGEIENYRTNNQDLGSLLNYLQSDQAVEESARLNLGYKKPGERVVVVKDDTLKLTDAQPKEEENLSNPQRWQKYFFN